MGGSVKSDEPAKDAGNQGLIVLNEGGVPNIGVLGPTPARPVVELDVDL